MSSGFGSAQLLPSVKGGDADAFGAALFLRDSDVAPFANDVGSFGPRFLVM